MNHRHALAGVLSVTLLALTAGTASGQVADKDSFSFSFTTAKKKAAAGYSLEAEFPTQRIIDQLTITLPKGTKVDTGAGVECGISEDEYDDEKLSTICPPKSKIGTGTGSAFIGGNTEPTTFSLEYYNIE